MSRKKRRRQPKPDSDSQALRGAVLSLITGIGYGSLSMIARQLQISPANLRKRLTTALNGFDGPTMRACALLQEMQATEAQEPGTGTVAGGYEIFETPDGHKWRKTE